MQFRNLKRQYQNLKSKIDSAVMSVLSEANFISGDQVTELEKILADYVGVKHCITCANGTDALQISLIAMDIQKNDAVFVPDFTFFSSAEAVAQIGAIPVFVDIDLKTYNINPLSLETAIKNILKEGKLIPKAIIAVDLFGLTADYKEIKKIVKKYNMKILEDGAQGFGAEYFGKKACCLGDISTTSFFPAKPLGCYGDGGAIFTNNDEYALMIRSLCVHGKGADKYHNIRIGFNSRLDTIQAAILIEKLKAFNEYELQSANNIADKYTKELSEIVKVPNIPENYYSSWAQYTIRVKDKSERCELQSYLKKSDIPTNIYYILPMHKQEAFYNKCIQYDTENTEKACETVLSLPFDPYMTDEEVKFVCNEIKKFYFTF